MGMVSRRKRVLVGDCEMLQRGRGERNDDRISVLVLVNKPTTRTNFLKLFF